MKNLILLSIAILTTLISTAQKEAVEKVKSKILGNFIASTLERNLNFKTKFKNNDLDVDEFWETDEGKKVEKIKS
jgi:hypothetical protein